ncbi:MAG: carbohydrate kinase family protein [Chloroflexi bacterium]|nr:carbohydrate kinase family protein [Chloroflexota bacterium]
MGKILVSGLINIETTVKVDGFPVAYAPVRYPFFGVNSTVSGVGYNVAKALVTLGDEVHFLSLIGKDLAGETVHAQLKADGIPGGLVARELDQTPQSVIMYEPSGRRAINVDLKDIQETPYPPGLFEFAASSTSLAVLCNINFSRPFLAQMKDRGVPIATDVHAISDLASDYDGAFMQYADILFLSDEGLPCSPEEWARRIWDRYGTAIVVIGLGGEGALLAVRADNRIERFPAVYTRDVVNTIGAGDALFSCFVHHYNESADPYAALKRAMVFASYKVGVAGAADGFLNRTGLETWCEQVYGE